MFLSHHCFHSRTFNLRIVRPLLSHTETKFTRNTENYSARKKFSSSQDDYQFLQLSKVPTLHFQPSLPRLPIPELDKTCERYLNSLTPLVSTEELNKTRQIVQKFQSNEGKSLNEELKALDKKNKHTSYISAPWFDMYLRSRDSIVLNYNPFMAFVDDPKPEYNNQLIRSTNILISSLRFLRSLRGGILEPEVFHLNPAKSNNETFRTVTGLLPSIVSWYGAYMFNAYPLDMSQYSNLFNSTRIAELDKDRLFKDESARHVLVIKNGRFYTFDVLDENGNILDSDYIHKCMKHIVEDLKSQPPTHPIGYLTSEERNTWAKTREQLVKNGNVDSLRRIDSALFALILDSTEPGDDPIKLVRNMLYGDGSNRWFEKSFQLIVTKDGKAAINFEHSWGDGVAVLRFFNEIFEDSTSKPRIHPNTAPSVSVDPTKFVSEIEIKLDDACKQAVEAAKEKYKITTDSLSVDFIMYSEIGKSFLKKKKISPDAIMQLSFQMAFLKLTGRTVASYESCSTAAFRHGRTETIRPATIATKECSQAMIVTPRPSESTLRALLDKCSNLHNKLTKNAAMGQGFDRHLFALRMIAEGNKMKTPAIFSDPSYSLINHNIISTSTLSSPYASLGGFGPVVKDGLGVAYLIADDYAGCIVTSYPPNQDGHGFIQCVESSLSDIHNVLNK